MRRHLLGILVFGLLGVACVDLFHSTDFQTICDVHPDTNGCPNADAGPETDAAIDAGDPLCTDDAAKAQEDAKRVCAFDGACNGTTKDHGYGLCLFEALRAFDCQADPGQAPRGQREAYWRCMKKANSCADYRACAGNTTACSGGSEQCAPNGVTVQRCISGGSFQQTNCAAEGKVCANLTGQAQCTGPTRDGCAGTGCFDNNVRRCNSGLDVGRSCDSFGSGTCVEGVAVAACKPLGTETCTPTNKLTVSGTQISACATGVKETVDCARVLLAPAPPAGYLELGNPGDLSSACGPPRLGGGCTASCNGKVFTACFRSTPQTLDCSTQKLGACILDADTNEPRCLPP
jgi:hypothetical protein